MTIRAYVSKKTGKTVYNVCVRKKGLISSRTFTNRQRVEEWEAAEGKRLLIKAFTYSEQGYDGHIKLSKVVEAYRDRKLSTVSKSWSVYLKGSHSDSHVEKHKF